MPASDPVNTPADPALLARQIRGFARRLKRQLRAQGEAHELTPSQVSALLRLDEHGPHTTSALARAEGMRSQSMGAVVAALVEAGMVIASPDPKDGRQMLLTVSPDCRAWLKRNRAVREDWLSRRIAGRLSDEERARLSEAMVLLGRLVAEPDEH